MKANFHRFYGACKAFYADYPKKVKHFGIFFLSFVCILLCVIITFGNNKPVKYSQEEMEHYTQIAQELYNSLPAETNITDDFSVSINSDKDISLKFKKLKNPDIMYSFANGNMPRILTQSSAEIDVKLLLQGVLLGFFFTVGLFLVFFIIAKVILLLKNSTKKFLSIFRGYLLKEDLKNFSDNEYVSEDYVEFPSKENSVYSDIDDSLKKM